MISEFDKNGALALYKREFTESLYTGDYETALDNLLKYDEAVGYADFHLACGKLYLLMSQDSDDNELLVMAFRELMMHLSRNPECTSAYRDLLAVQMLRHDPAGTLECAEFAKRNGIETENMFYELSQAGVDIFMDESKGLDLDGLLEPGEFGDIELIDGYSDDWNDDDEKEFDDENKVIKFRGNGGYNAEHENKTVVSDNNKRVVEIKSPDNFIIEDGDRLSDIDGDGFEYVDYGIGDEDMPPELAEKLKKANKSDMAAKIALRKAEDFGDIGDYESAMRALEKIKPSDGHYYYCAECLRAFVYLQHGDFGSAQTSLDNAFKIHRNGALATTIQCKLYEDTEEYEKIPSALKHADVKDYTDASHVYQAMIFAVKYCKPKDAIALAEDYIEEFNTMDIRLMYAQLLYNNGKRKSAVRELYKLSRIFYDDFNTVYYYNQALMGVREMPVDDQAPQDVVTEVVEGFMSIHNAGIPSNKLIESPDYKLTLELFLSLELPKQRKLLAEMTDILRRIVNDKRYDGKIRDALVSPYVDPLIKAIILTKFFAENSEYTVALGFVPDSSKVSDIKTEKLDVGMKTAVAYIMCLDRKIYDEFDKTRPYFSRLFKAVKAANIDITDTDEAYYILKSLNSNAVRDSRLITVLGYENKRAATDACETIDAVAKKLR